MLEKSLKLSLGNDKASPSGLSQQWLVGMIQNKRLAVEIRRAGGFGLLFSLGLIFT
jgi:hypothetical protein